MQPIWPLPAHHGVAIPLRALIPLSAHGARAKHEGEVAILRGPALDRLEAEHDNLRAGLARTIERADGDTSIWLAFALWRYWQKRGHLYEARRTLDTIAEQPWSRDDPRLRARLMEALGGVERALG